MTDVFSREFRSAIMAKIGGKNTLPEISLRKGLHALGLRFRLHAKNLPGKPDIYLPRYRAAVFVHGCFWHRHEGCRYSTTPQSNIEFWNAKFLANIERDKNNDKLLTELGWTVFIVWGCQLRTSSMIIESATLLAEQIRAVNN